MTVAIRELRNRLRLEAPIDRSDGAGGTARTYRAVATVFGKVEPRRRSEGVEAGRVVGLVTHRITVRHREDVKGGMRFLCHGRLFRVKSVEDADPLRRFLTCWCEEEQS